MASKMVISDAKHITLYLADGSTMAGWSFVDGELRHTTRQFLALSPTKAAEVAAAIATCRPGSTETKSGAQVAALPESERGAWQFEVVKGDATGIYVRIVPATIPTVEFATVDVTGRGRR